MKALLYFTLACISPLLIALEEFTAARPPLLPQPQHLEWTDKSSPIGLITITCEPNRISIMEQAHLLLVNYVSENSTPMMNFTMRLADIPQKSELADWQKKESYHLLVNDKGIHLTAPSETGLFRGLQTLRQLLTKSPTGYSIAHCDITDWPDLSIRGLMNDVGRNYMPIELIKKEIDAMAMLKYNVYHFHLTENEGWRLESKLYPEINKPEHFTRMPDHFYTQKEFQELVEYCATRHITLIPELDMPGHTAALQRALGVKKMEDPRVTQVLVDLIGELATLAPKERMPYIHIGTDEAKGHERVSDATLTQYYQAVEKAGRKAIRWQPGIAAPAGVKKPIEHLWTGRLLRHSHPTKGSSYIDSQESYLNHLDPFELACTFYFRRPCPFKWATGIGFILCSWPDLPIVQPENQLLQTPIFSALAFASEPLWNSIHEEYKGDINQDPLFIYFSNLPPQGSSLLRGFADYENRVIAIRDKFFVDTPFPYVRQAHIPWKMIGPFPHEGKHDTIFPVESSLLRGEKPASTYTYEGKEYSWLSDIQSGHTIIMKHYANYATPLNGGAGFKHPQHTWYALQYIYSPKKQEIPFWIGAQTWANSERTGGPVNVKGEWHYTKARFYVNGEHISPPTWQINNPGLQHPFIDENYHFRSPTMITLKEGWNQILIKSPSDPKMRRWMFTFAPITEGVSTKEYPGLRFSTEPK